MIRYTGNTQRRVLGERILPGRELKRGDIPDDAYDALSKSSDFEAVNDTPKPKPKQKSRAKVEQAKGVKTLGKESGE